MEEDSLQHIVAPDLSLERRNSACDTDRHCWRATYTQCSASPHRAAAVGPARRSLLEHVTKNRTAVLDAPPAVDLVRNQEGEAHE